MTPNLVAFLAMIARCEVGTTAAIGYRTRYGGGTFDSFADHPRKPITAGRYTSTAAGRYQALAGTWDDFCRAKGKGDFSPARQDQFAVWCITRRGALADVEAGRIPEAIARCGKEWASLPGSPYGQPVRTLAECLGYYKAAGGTLASVQIPAQVDGRLTTPPPITRKSVDPLTAISVFGPIIANLIPQVSKIFGGGERAQQNVALATTVLDTVVKATGAVNEQEAVQKMQADPAVAQVAKDAVLTQPDVAAVLEVGGGIAEARKADVAATQADKSFWYSPAFWISVAMLLLPFMLVTDALFVHPDGYTENLRTQIVTAVLAVIMVVGGYYLGSSAGSAKKDDALVSKGQQ